LCVLGFAPGVACRCRPPQSPNAAVLEALFITLPSRSSRSSRFSRLAASAFEHNSESGGLRLPLCFTSNRAIVQSCNREDDVSRPLTTRSARFYFEKVLLLHSATASLWRGEPKRPWNPGSRFFNHFLPPPHSHSGDLKRGMPAPALQYCKYCPNDIGEPAPCKLLQNLLPLSLPAVLTLT